MKKLHAIRRIVREFCKEWGVRPPRVAISRTPKPSVHAEYYPLQKMILLREPTLSYSPVELLRVVIHESVHHIQLDDPSRSLGLDIPPAIAALLKEVLSKTYPPSRLLMEMEAYSLDTGIAIAAKNGTLNQQEQSWLSWLM